MKNEKPENKKPEPETKPKRTYKTRFKTEDKIKELIQEIERKKTEIESIRKDHVHLTMEMKKVKSSIENHFKFILFFALVGGGVFLTLFVKILMRIL